jgi:hypothetical protein
VIQCVGPRIHAALIKKFRATDKCRVSIKKFKALGAISPLSLYLLMFTPSVRRHFVLPLSIFPLSLSRRRPAVASMCVSLDGGGHDHGTGHDHRHGVSEVWRQHERGVACQRCARARHGAVASCSYRGQRERGILTELEDGGRILTELEDGGARRFVLMAVRCIGTPPRDVDGGGNLPR